MSAELRTKIILISFYCIGYIALFGTQVYLTRHLSLDDYGDLSVALNIASLLAIFAVLGFSGAALKLIPRFASEASFAELKGFILTGAGSTLIIGVLISFLTIGALYILNETIGLKEHPVMLSVSMIIPLAFYWYSQDVVIAQNQFFKAAFLVNIGFPGSLFLIAFGFAYFSTNTVLTEGMAVKAYSYAYCVNVIIFSVLILYFWKSQYGLIRPQFKSKEWFVEANGFVIAAAPYVAILAASMLMLETLQPNEDDVGIFSAALVIAGLQLTLLDGVRVFALNELSIAIKKNDMTEMTAILRPALRILVLLGLIIVTALWTMGDLLQILNISGRESRIVIGTLGMALFINVISGLLMNIMQLAGKMTRAALTNLSILLLNVLLSLLLIPRFSAEGAAIALLLAYLIPFIANLIWIRSKMGIPYLGCIFSH